MTNVKCFLLRLYLLTYSPIFPMLLGSTIFIVYRIFFEPTILCDGWDVMNLKYELTKQIGVFRCADVRLQEYIDRCEQIQRMPATEAVQREEQICLENLRIWRDRYLNSLYKVRHLEVSLTMLDSNYRTVVDENFLFPKVSRASGV